MSLLSAHCSREQRRLRSAFRRLCTSLLCDFQSSLHSLHFYAFLGNVPPCSKWPERSADVQPDATELSKAGLAPCGEEKHDYTVMSYLAVAVSSVLMIQQCVLNNASGQKYTPNKITYRTAKKQNAQRHGGSSPSVSPWGNGSEVTEQVFTLPSQNTAAENAELSVCMWLPGHL